MIVRAENLTPEQKAAFESLLGRPIAAEEEFLVDSYKRPGKILPSTVTDEEREKAWEGLEAHYAACDKARALSGISEEEEEAIILEALRSTRPDYRHID